jgi:hydroxymethylpyrimidine pyrophosphatase-like HAD family hydrolase
MTFVIDIDGTLLISRSVDCDECYHTNYFIDKVDKKEIALVNKAAKKGHTIILYTGRGWDQYEITKEQLKKAKIKYHELVMGKPQGIYVDKDAITSLKDVIK